MDKKYLDDFIDKYYLGGMIDNTIWRVRKNKLSTSFVSEKKEMMGHITFNNFKHSDADIGIVDSERTKKLLSVLNGKCDLVYEKDDKDKDRIVRLIVDDGFSVVKISTAHLSIFPTDPKLKVVPPWDLQLKMNNESALAFIKGADVITEKVHFTIVRNKKNYKLIIGYDKKCIDMVEIPVELVSGELEKEISFSSWHLRAVLKANKNADISFNISSAGLMKCDFTTKDYSAIYHLVALRV